MRTPLLCLAALALPAAPSVPAATRAAASAPAPAKPHTWTDKQGRTITGEFVDADATEVTIRREDGSIVRLSRDLLTPQDSVFADKAMGAKPITVKIEASRKRFESARDETTKQGQIITTDQWGYSVTLESQTRRKAENLRADYVLYVQQATMKNGVQADGAKIHRSGSLPLASLDQMASANFQTNRIPTKKIELKPGWTWSKTGNSDQIIDTLDGIWLRIYQGDNLIAEYLSSESFRKAGWPSDAPKPPGANTRGGRRAGGAATPAR